MRLPITTIILVRMYPYMLGAPGSIVLGWDLVLLYTIYICLIRSSWQLILLIID